MKICKKRSRGSIFSLLLKNYIIFTIVIVITLFAITFFGTKLFPSKAQIPLGLSEVEKNILKDGDYKKLDFRQIAGPNGVIDILDESNDVIYHMGVDNYIDTYTDRELEFIHNYDGGDTYNDLYYLLDDDGNKLTVLLRSKTEITTFENISEIYHNSKKEDFDGWFEVLDKDLNVIYRGGQVKEYNESYSIQELGYLTFTYPEGYDIYKFSYEDFEGKERTAIIKMEKVTNDGFEKKVKMWIEKSAKLFILVYGLCIVAFVIILKEKVKKPLNKIEGAMIDLAERRSNEPLEYNGPKEFVDICDSFNMMAEKLRHSEEAKDKLSSDKQRMLADISHDLKTPITTIQGYAKALSDGVIKKEDQRKYFNIIYYKSTRLTDLINMFYEYSKLDHPDFELNFTREDLSEFIRAYVALKYQDILDAGFEIEVDIPEEKMYAYIDKLQLQRVFENLLCNSLKHNPEGTKVFVGLTLEDDNYKILIADNGIGISKDIAPNIFEAFTVGDESRNTKNGTGLGLAIVRRLIDMHNGRVLLESDESQYYKTRFTIIIPKEQPIK